jgi:hypothetical protein
MTILTVFSLISKAIILDWFSATSDQKIVFDIQSNERFSIFISISEIE